MDREVDVKRVRVDHPSGPILSDQSTISSSVILPQSHHPTLPPPPPQQSGTPTVPAPVSAPVSAHIVSQPYSAPPTRNTQAITYPPPTRPSTTPLHAQPVGPPPSGSVVSFHPYGPVTQQPQRTNSQDLSASRPSSASGQPDPHRPEWPSSAMEPNGSAPRPHQQSQVYGHHGLETPLNGMPMSVSGPTIMGPYTVQTSVQAPVQPRVEHYPAGYPQTPVVANFGNQTPYGTSPPNYAMVGKPHRKSARAQQVSTLHVLCCKWNLNCYRHAIAVDSENKNVTKAGHVHGASQRIFLVNTRKFHLQSMIFVNLMVCMS
jgi:hypothetical protein